MTISAPGLGAMSVQMGSDGNMHMEVPSANMTALIGILTGMVDRPILDETGLKGSYQVSLDLAAADFIRKAASVGVGIPMGTARIGAPADGASDPGATIFAAIETLGLKLEPRKEAVDTVVVDHAEKTPIEN
jgi:uncharacterized protein (TIGR03435 family)